jgi:hypothetical protein
LKQASKSCQDEKCYTFDVAKCDRFFDYSLLEKQIKLSSNHVILSPEQVKKHAYFRWHNSYSHATNDYNIFCHQVQSAINEGRLKFVESLQMKLDKDLFPANLNMVEIDGNKVLVRPSQTESTNVKEVITGEVTPSRMIKPKSPKGDQWQKNGMSKTHQRPKATFDILIAKNKEGKTDIREREKQTIHNAKRNSLVSLSQASTSTAKSSSSKRSWTPP